MTQSYYFLVTWFFVLDTNVQIDYGNWWLIDTTFDLLLTFDPNLALLPTIPT